MEHVAQVFWSYQVILGSRHWILTWRYVRLIWGSQMTKQDNKALKEPGWAYKLCIEGKLFIRCVMFEIIVIPLASKCESSGILEYESFVTLSPCGWPKLNKQLEERERLLFSTMMTAQSAVTSREGGHAFSLTQRLSVMKEIRYLWWWVRGSGATGERANFQHRPVNKSGWNPPLNQL